MPAAAALVLLFTHLDLVLAAEPPAPAPTEGGRWALIIGVDDYVDPDILDLRFASRDAVAMAATLIQSGAYPSDHVVVMTPDHLNPAMRPTRTHILEQLRTLGQHAEADGLLFYFSGHGYRVELGGRLENVLLPMDTSMRIPEHTAIPAGEVLEQLGRSGVQQRLAIFDACRNDLTAARSIGADASWVLPPYAGEGTSALYCTRDGEVSYELQDQQLGACTASLIRGMQGEADANHDGVVGARELYEDVDARLQALDLPTPQRPTLASDLSGSDLAIAPVAGSTPTPSTLVCPSDRFTASSAVRAGLNLCAADEPSLIAAERLAREQLLCLGEQAPRELVVDFYRLEAQLSRRLQNPGEAVAWLRAAQEAMPEQDLRLGLDERCWMSREEELARSAPPSRTTPVAVPRGARLLWDGRVSDKQTVDRPGFAQVLNPDRSVQWSRIVRPGDSLPPLSLPTPVMVRRHTGGTLLTTAGGGVLLGGALFGAGLLVERSFHNHASCQGEDDQPCVEEVTSLARLANGLAYAGEATWGVSIGAFGVGLWMKR